MLNVKTILFQTIQFSLSTQFSSIWPIHRTLLGAATPDQSGPGRIGNEEVFRIPQSSGITGISPSDCQVSYTGHLFGFFTPLKRCRLCILYPHPIRQQQNINQGLLKGFFFQPNSIYPLKEWWNFVDCFKKKFGHEMSKKEKPETKKLNLFL